MVKIMYFFFRAYMGVLVYTFAYTKVTKYSWQVSYLAMNHLIKLDLLMKVVMSVKSMETVNEALAEDAASLKASLR